MKIIMMITGFLAMILGLMAQTAVLPTGDGTETTPYRIAIWQNLYWISQTPSSWNKHFIQTDNIIFPTEINAWNNYQGLTSIGTYNAPFTGHYNGNHKTISNIYINRNSADNVGFFGKTDNALIKNLRIENVNVTADFKVGALIGYNDNSIVDSCSSSGIVNGNSDIGGLIGDNSLSTLTYSYSNCNSYGNYEVGGLIGDNYESTVSRCFSTGNPIAEDNDVGGLVGVNTSSGTITECYATGNVHAYGSVGGLVGANSNDSVIKFSFSTGAVYGSGTGIGGFVGHNYDGAIVHNCYSRSILNRLSGSTSTKIGGFIGENQSSNIINCFSTGYLVFESIPLLNDKGFVGINYDSSTFTNNFFDSQSSHQVSSIGALPKTSLEMKSQDTFINWDFENYWQINDLINNGYPSLKWQNELFDILLIDFQAHYDEEGLISISWSTQAENNLVGFCILKSNQPDFNQAIQLNSHIIPANNSLNVSTYEINDYNISNDSTYFYWLKMIKLDGEQVILDSISINTPVNTENLSVNLKDYLLNYPNPFNPFTNIAFNISQSSNVKIYIFNIKGQKVKELVNQFYSSGYHTIVWDGKDSEGVNCASGLYFSKMITDKTVQIKKMMMIK